MTTDLLTGLCIGLLIWSGIAFIINELWFREWKRLNDEWASLCTEINESWYERCKEARNGENLTYEKTVKSSTLKSENPQC